MSSVTVDIKEFEAGIAPAFDSYRAIIREGVELGAEVWEQDARRLCPERADREWGHEPPGTLRESIHHGPVTEQPGRVSVDLIEGEGLRYPWYVEAGTGRGPAQPHFRPAMATAIAAMERFFRRA